MAKTCVWTPCVKTRNGETRESKLYKDILNFTSNDRKKALDLYYLVRGDDFQRVFRSVIKYDDAEEPIFSSFIGKVKVKNLFNDKLNIENAAKSIGATDDSGETVYLDNTAKNYIELSSKAIQFNDSGSYGESYIAVVRKNDKGLYVSVEKKTEDNEKLSRELKFNYELNNKLKGILSRKGIDLDNLYTLQEEIKANGTTDYENASTLAEGLLRLLRLADSMEGEKALPEEYSHFLLDCLRGENIFVDRLFSMLDRNDLFKQVLGDSYQSYLEDYSKEDRSEEEVRDMLIREAAGKMVSEAMTNPDNQYTKKYEFFSNLIAKIKDFIKKVINGKEINQALVDARNTAYSVATTILNADDKITQEKLDKLKQLPDLKQLSRRVKSAEQVVQESMDKALKKYDYYAAALEAKLKRTTDEDERNNILDSIEKLKTQTQEFMSNQKQFFQNKEFNKALTEYIQYASKDIEDCQKRLNSILEHKYLENQVPYQLRNIRNIIKSHIGVVDDIRRSISYGDAEFTLEPQIKSIFDDLIRTIHDIDDISKTESIECFSKFLQAYLPEGGISYSNINGERTTISRNDISALLETAERDISTLDMWLNSAAETKDIIIKLSDRAIKEKKNLGMQKVIGIQKRLLAKAKLLRDKHGMKAEEFIFERHADGTMSSRYKSDINWTAWYDSKAEKAKEIQKGLDEGQTGAWARDQWRLWRKANCTDAGLPDSKYRNANFQDGWSKEQKEYYDTFMDIRSTLINYLPMDTYSSMDPYKAIQITKDLWERIKNVPLGEIPKAMALETKKFFTGKVDDTDFGSYTSLTFDGKRQYGVPIYFIRNVEKESDLSRDATSTLIAFADMAVNYNQMGEILDIFELGKSVVEERTALDRRGGKALTEKLSGFGHTSVESAVKNAENIVKRFNHLIESQVYGKYISDATVGDTNIKQSRISNFLIRWTSLCTLALNKLAGEAAIINDMINIDNEAISGRNFTGKELLEADRQYIKYLPRVIKDIHNPIKSDKLSLFIEKFNVLHEYENDVRDIRWDTSKLKKLASENTLYIFMTMGSHFGETRTALAQAMHIKITSADGRTKSLWDALHVVPLDKNNPELGSTLEIEEGFTLSPEDVSKYITKFMALNQRLFGVYNKGDKNMLQSTAIGQLAMLYRKFMIPAINRRFRSGDYNLDLDEETEGFYFTVGRYLYDVVTDSKHVGRSFTLYYNRLSDYQKKNIWKAAREILMFGLLSLLTLILKSLDWDKKDNPWVKREIMYLTARAKTELGAFTPFGITGETWNLLKSPFATLNVLERAGDLINIVNPVAWTTEVERGRYKGHSKAFKSIMESIPMSRTVYAAFHPEEKMISFR